MFNIFLIDYFMSTLCHSEPLNLGRFSSFYGKEGRTGRTEKLDILKKKISLVEKKFFQPSQVYSSIFPKLFDRNYYFYSLQLLLRTIYFPFS